MEQNQRWLWSNSFTALQQFRNKYIFFASQLSRGNQIAYVNYSPFREYNNYSLFKYFV